MASSRYRGWFFGILGSAMLLGGCASGPKGADRGAIDVAGSFILDSRDITDVAVHGLLGKASVKDVGSYKTFKHNFCPNSYLNPATAMERFRELCGQKRGVYDGAFCMARAEVDSVLFMGRLVSAGYGDCLTIQAADPTSNPADPTYLSYLLSNGYKPVAARRQIEQEKVARVARAQAEARAAVEERAAREQARLAVELPRIKKRGTLVCYDDGQIDLRGYVEDFTDEKIKVLVVQGRESGRANWSMQINPGTYRWDNFVAWRLC